MKRFHKRTVLLSILAIFIAALLLIVGIFLGTFCWWSVLSGVTAAFRSRINHRIYQVLNWVLGCFMLIFGGVILIKDLFL